MSKLFENPANHDWMTVILVFAALLIIAGVGPSTPEEMEMRLPTLNDPAMWFIFLIVAVIIIWSWFTCGSDHEENVNAEHPDGQLTYPGDKKNE